MSDKLYLICDCVGSANVEVLTESTKRGDELLIRGKFQEADAENKNKRVYPMSVLKPQVEALQEAIKNNGLLGELDHPTDSIIHFENASHLVTRLEWKGHELHGEARIIDTPAGKILRSLISEGIKIGISSRGVGSGKMNAEGLTVINDGFKLITFDVVADPSTKGAFLSTEAQDPDLDELPQVQESPTPQPTATESTESTAINTPSSVNTVTESKIDPQVVEAYLRLLFENQKKV